MSIGRSADGASGRHVSQNAPGMTTTDEETVRGQRREASRAPSGWVPRPQRSAVIRLAIAVLVSGARGDDC